MSVGARLKEERERVSPTQAAFIAAVGVTKKTQFNFENDRNLPGGAYLIAAAAQGVDVQYVLTGVKSLNCSPREQAVLRTFRALPPTVQDEAQEMVAAKSSARNSTTERNAQMKNLSDKGTSFAEIGRRYGVSGPRVAQIVYGLRNKELRRKKTA